MFGRRDRVAWQASIAEDGGTKINSAGNPVHFTGIVWAGSHSRFFLYHEDVDLSLHLRLAGGELGIQPTAIVDHNYEFGARQHKWRWLERNRWAFLIRIYPARLLILVLPGLIATELALIFISLRGGWGRQKLGAIYDVARWLPRLLRERQSAGSATHQRRGVR